VLGLTIATTIPEKIFLRKMEKCSCIGDIEKELPYFNTVSKRVNNHYKNESLVSESSQYYERQTKRRNRSKETLI
jgi:hypothetical protein